MTTSWPASLQITPIEAAAELIARRQARSRLEAFTRYTMPEYEANWHHQAVCHYLDRFIAGDVKRLMVFMPPRHGKSELVSRRLPAFIFGRQPDARIITCSYSADLASRMNRDVQRIVDDDRYHAVFPDTRLSGRNIRTIVDGSWLRNSDIFEIVGRRGMYRSAGVGGGITGMGFDYGIIDDPIKNQEEAESRTFRDALDEWYTSTFYTRREKGAGILLTMTRWHDDDLAGRLLKRAKADPGAEQWVVVRFPARAEAQPAMDEDQRAEGAPLWSAKFDDADLEKTQAAVGLRSWYALYQQTPRMVENALLDPSRLIMIDREQLPTLVKIVRRWDLAFSEAHGADFVSGAKLGVDEQGRRYILHIRRSKGRWTNSRPIIIETAISDGVSVAQYIEANGTQLGYYQDIHDDERLKRFVVEPDRPEGSKEMRASVWGSRLIDGIIYCVRGDWNQELFDQMQYFPGGEHDDDIDAISGAWDKLSIERRGFSTSYR